MTEIPEIGNKIFYAPGNLLDFNSIVKHSLSGNTFRGFHRIDKKLPGASLVFRSILKQKESYIIHSLSNAKSEYDIDELSRHLTKDLHEKLLINIYPKQLDSFNKIRKPIDIFIEHIVALFKGFPDETRKTIVTHLFLPLDSKIFKSELVFSDSEIKQLKIKRNYTYSSIKNESHYYEIQAFLAFKFSKLNTERVFLDLIWGNRYKAKGKNLLELNPQKRAKKPC